MSVRKCRNHGYWLRHGKSVVRDCQLIEIDLSRGTFMIYLLKIYSKILELIQWKYWLRHLVQETHSHLQRTCPELQEKDTKKEHFGYFFRSKDWLIFFNIFMSSMQIIFGRIYDLNQLNVQFIISKKKICFS